MKTLWLRATIIVSAALFSGWVCLAIYTDINYSIVMPKAPDTASGRIHRLVVNHGYVVFVDEDELKYKWVVDYDLFLVAICFFGIAGYLNMKHDVFPAIRPFRRWRK